MKIIAYMALHYGTDYIEAAIRSTIESVDEFHVLYAAQPSHGSRSGLVCPDSENDLHALAWQVAGTKLRWHTGGWLQENEQRNSILQYAPDADVILIVDSDEIFSPQLVDKVLDYSGSVTNSIPPFRYLRLPFVHYYRNFRSCIVHDPAFPVRVIFPRIDARYGESSWNPVYANGVVNHMGYCQRAEIIRYKLGIHGHTGQFRCTPDEYVDNIYLDHNRWTDLHPIGSEYWNTEAVNPLDRMPAWMEKHPYFSREWVE